MIESILILMRRRTALNGILSLLCLLLLLPLPAAADHRHSVDRWTVTKDPTCTEQGEKIGVCSLCGKKVLRFIEAEGHDFGDEVRFKKNGRARTCLKCGAAEYEYVLTAEKDTAMRLVTGSEAQQITFAFSEGYAGDFSVTVSAGEAAALLFSVPGGRTQETGLSDNILSLPKEGERQNLLLPLPEHMEPFTFTLRLPADAARELTVTLPAGTGIDWTMHASEEMTVTVTGQDAGSTVVRPVRPELCPRLVSGDVIEIEYPEPVTCDAQAKALFSVTVGGQEAEWEFLSYFDFGTYAERGGVVSLRLGRALDIGLPPMYADKTCITPSTQEQNGPSAAAAVTVTADGVTEEAVFAPFWSEIRYNEETGAAVWVAAGAEQADIPATEDGLTVHLLPSDRSVYEDPAYRSLYVPGKTDDTFFRLRILGENGMPVTVRSSTEN